MDAASRLQTLGPYRMGQRLGVGGMAEVFSAESDEFGQVALKRILPGLAQDRDFADMFWDEARMTSRLDHPNIVKILDYGRIDGQLYMALEYVGGPNLARVLRKAARIKLAVNPSAIVGMVVDLLEALHYVHTAKSDRGSPLGIVHRDVSPGNVMLTAGGEVKLGDFGIIRSDAVVRRTLPGELKGKMGYMSPEQALGGSVGPESDIFSVGIILAEFLTLRPLLLGKTEMHTLSRTVAGDLSTWRRHSETVPAALKAIVEKALSVEARDRFTSAREMARELLCFAEANHLDLSPALRVEELRKLEMLPGGQQRSGERRIMRRRSETSPGAQPGERAISEPATLVEVHSVTQRPGSIMKPQGRPVWTVDFCRSSLPMRLISAFRRVSSGVVELTSANGDHRLTIELRGGAFFAVHDSEGHYPLGRLLREASLLSTEQLAVAIGESRRSKLRLGQYLVMHGQLRESTLLRLLAKQGELRIGRWLNTQKGRIAVHPQGAEAAFEDGDSDPRSVASLVAILRRHVPRDALPQYLGGAIDAVVMPAHGVSVPPPGLTEPEVRVLRTTMRGGAYEGCAVRSVVSNIENERIARRDEAMFALLVGLSSGFILASGFGREESS